MATNPALFAAWMTPYAEQASAATGLDVGLIIAQWGNETAWGTQFAESNNIGNIGVYSGGPNPSYPTLAAGVQAYINEMNSPALAKAKAQWQGQTAQEQAVIIGNSGYAGGGYNNGSGPGSSLIADMQTAGVGADGASAPGAALAAMSPQEQQAMQSALAAPGGQGYFAALNAQQQASNGTGAASGAGTTSTSSAKVDPGTGQPADSSTNIGGVTYGGVGTTTAQTSALSTIETNLASYGFTGTDLSTLTNWAWGEISNNNDPSQVALDLMNPATTGGSIFAQKFPDFGPVNTALQAQGQQPLSVADYMSLTKSYEQSAQAAGLPAGMLTQDDMATLMKGNVSANELSDRLNTAIGYTLSTPAAQDQFNAYFGKSYGDSGTNTPLTLGQMAAIVLDPTKAEPLLQQQLVTAQIGGSSVTSGVGAIDAATATKLAQAGVTVTQANNAFQNIAPLSSLERARPGMGGEAAQGVVTPGQLATGNLLGDPAAQRQEQTAVEVAKAPFVGGGGPVTTSKGAVGAGSANPSGVSS